MITFHRPPMTSRETSMGHQAGSQSLVPIRRLLTLSAGIVYTLKVHSCDKKVEPRFWHASGISRCRRATQGEGADIMSAGTLKTITTDQLDQEMQRDVGLHVW